MTPGFAALELDYGRALLEDVVPFWLRHSLDTECGGYFTCLGRDGSVFDTDKFVWLQARQVWTLSMLCERLGARDDWIAAARLGADFLLRSGRDGGGNWYFSLTREGKPLVQPCSLFSDCFAAMAFSQFARVTGDEEARLVAGQTYRNIMARKADPKGRFSKAVPGTRPMVSLAVPMILANVTQELEWLLDAEAFNLALDGCIEQVFSLFLSEGRGILREHASPDGAPLDCFEGRTINPGHGLEAMRFMLDIAERRNDRALAERAVDVALRTLEFGWDADCGGLFYFMDEKGRPPQQLEWDQKLWWVHVEALVAALKGFRMTRRRECWEWFERLHAYTWGHFPDPQFGEWFGYLDRRGAVLLSLKGGKWKGCFHVPRGLFLCGRELSRLREES